MYINDVILNVGQFFDDETKVIVGGVEVGALPDEGVEDSNQLIMMVDFSFYLYNMSYINNINELIAVTEELSEEEAYMIHTLRETKEILAKDYLVMTVSDFDWLEEFHTLENKFKVLNKFINYCEYNNYDYLAIIVEKEFPNETKQGNITEFPKIKQYEALGFERININPTPIMVKKLNEI